MGFVELILKVSFDGERVDTDLNLADWFTRSKLHKKGIAFFEYFEQCTGITPWRLDLKSMGLGFLREGWTKSEQATGGESWYNTALQWMEWMAVYNPGLLETHCRVDPAEVLQALRDSIERKPVEAFPKFDFNFPERSGPSETRRALTSLAHPTRMMLHKRTLGDPRGLSAMRLEAGVQSNANAQEVINATLQRDFEVRYNAAQVEANLSFDEAYVRPLPPAPRTVDLTALGRELCRNRVVRPLGFTVTSGYSGQEGCGKAAEFVGGTLKYSAEINPALEEHTARHFPDAVLLGDVAKLFTLAPESATVGVFSTTCTSYSAANLKGRKNADPVTGKCYEEVGTFAEHLRFAVFASECTPGVRSRHQGKPSALEELTAKAPSYHVVAYDIDASEVVSPITGEQAPMNHVRTWAFGFRRDLFQRPPAADLIERTVPKLPQFSSFLDSPEEAAEYRVMPKDDRRDLEYEFQQGPSGIAYVATIADPEPGRGHTHFVNRVVSAELGRCPTHTAAAGSVWIQESLNGSAVVRLLRNAEMARTMLARGFETGPDAKLMEDRCEAGQGTLGNMLPQNVPDLVMTQIALWLATVQGDGRTAQEKWETPAAPARAMSKYKLCPGKAAVSTARNGAGTQTRSKYKPRSWEAPASAEPAISEPALSSVRSGAGAQAPTATVPTIVVPPFNRDEKGTGAQRHAITGLAIRVPSIGRPRSGAGAPTPKDPSSAGRKRLKPDITPEVDQAVTELQHAVQEKGKSKNTVELYSGGERHWRDCMDAKGWGHYLTDLPYEEKVNRATYFAAYEVKQHGIDVGSLRAKFSAIRWMHVRDRRPNPFKDLDSLTDWIADYGKMCSPPEPKVAVPAMLLELVKMHLDLETLDGCVIHAAQCIGFWFLLRSIEYLANDEGIFDPGRSLTFGDLILRDAQNAVVPLSQIAQATQLTITVYSGKGALHTCTRSIHRNKENPSCPLVALQGLYAVYVKRYGKPPAAADSLFVLENKEVLTRAGLATVLKQAAVACGVAASRVATHSLRRGGASAYAAAGVPDADVQRFGRWTSDGYKRYVTTHADMMKKGHADPAQVVPRFERN
jgi:hypothetical protein